MDWKRVVWAALAAGCVGMARAEASGAEDYNLPEAQVSGAADADLAPSVMERAAGAGAWEAFAQGQPADFWLFGERRDRAVRPNVLPAVWLSEHSAEPSASRVSCTAHLMPRRCMSLLVEISESMWCPLIISVRDIPTTKKATAAMAQSRTINQAGMAGRFLGV